MRWLVVVVVLALTACDPASVSESAAPGTATQSPASGEPQLPAADPVEISVEEFRAAAGQACATAQRKIVRAPLRGDPLHSSSRRRDITAAVRHFNGAARAWTAAANRLFDLGIPADPSGQAFIGALDSLALRSQQTAAALAAGDDAASQGALALLDEAEQATDASARGLGLGPLSECGRRARRQPPRRVRVTASDFAFRLSPPDRGKTRLVLRNQGEEDHHLFVVRLREPGTLAAAIAADRAGAEPGTFLAAAGQVSPVVRPGQRGVLDVRFRPGAYGLLCFVASPDGTPHAYKGMAAEILVD